jgi:UPF0755 protein
MRRFLGVLFLGLLLAAGWAVASLYLPYGSFPAGGIYVDIPHGASRRSIARILAEQGVVRSRWVFEGLSRWRGRRTLEAGEYFFDHPVTAFDVFDALANGRVYVRELLVPEGYSMFDIADLVEREGFTTREDFLAAARDPAPIHDLAPHAPSLEGFLFPATYEFPRHPSGQEMTTAMVKRFRQQWAGIVAQPDHPVSLPVEQVVTLASLVERETPKAEERPQVAAVFANRMRLGIPLQCDPTAVYAMELAGQYGGTLDAAGLRFDSPYNTYRHAGLPPGPIANPGEASLRAAMDPQPTDNLYFVANTEGGHFFAKTLAEHDRNVAIYRQRLAGERRDVAPAPTVPQPVSASKVRPRRSP